MAKRNTIEKRRKKAMENYRQTGMSKYERKRRELNRVEHPAAMLARCHGGPQK